MKKSYARIITSRIAGFIFFLVLLAIANILTHYFSNSIYFDIVHFLNSNLIIFLIIAFVGIINELFWYSYFPITLLGPVSGAVLSVYVVKFLYNFWNFLDLDYIHSNIILPIQAIYLIVVVLTLMIGYLVVLTRSGRPFYDKEDILEWRMNRLERKKEKLYKKMEKIQKRLDRKEVKWEEVGEEFKLAFYNLGKIINRAIEGEFDKRDDEDDEQESLEKDKDKKKKKKK